MISKKVVLWIGLVGFISFLVAIFLQPTLQCALVSIHMSCSEFLSIFSETIFISVPLFILSVVTYKISDEVFKTWIKFVYTWIPLTIILIFIMPEYGNGGFLFPIEKGVVSYYMSLLFFIISFIIIISKHFSLKKQSK